MPSSKPQVMYQAKLKIDSLCEASCEGADLNWVWAEISRYAAMYFGEGFQRSFVVEVRETKKGKKG